MSEGKGAAISSPRVAGVGVWRRWLGEPRPAGLFGCPGSSLLAGAGFHIHRCRGSSPAGIRSGIVPDLPFGRIRWRPLWSNCAPFALLASKTRPPVPNQTAHDPSPHGQEVLECIPNILSYVKEYFLHRSV